jgi:hypothetical protein
VTSLFEGHSDKQKTPKLFMPFISYRYKQLIYPNDLQIVTSHDMSSYFIGYSLSESLSVLIQISTLFLFYFKCTLNVASLRNIYKLALPHQTSSFLPIFGEKLWKILCRSWQFFWRISTYITESSSPSLINCRYAQGIYISIVCYKSCLIFLLFQMCTTDSFCDEEHTLSRVDSSV